MEKTILYTKNEFNLGDCIYSLIFFYNIADYINTNNIFIIFYCRDDNYPQINDFNNISNVIVLPISNGLPDTKIYDLWIGSPEYKYNWWTAIDESIIPYETYDIFFRNFYNNFLELLTIPIKIDKFVYSDPDLCKRAMQINNRTNNKYMNVDFFINNGMPRSGQWDYNIYEFNEFILKLSKKYSVVTTQKVENVPCTRDDNLSAKDIAAVSTNVKNIIAIESGVIAGLYNTYITENPDVRMYNLSNSSQHKCSFKNFHYTKTLSELQFLIDE